MVRQVEAIDRVADNLDRYGINADRHSDGKQVNRLGIRSVIHRFQTGANNFA